MNKSQAACEFNLDLLCEGRQAYLWTFTQARCIPCRETAARWRRVQRDLVRELGFRGVRVYEFHPGGHGLHVHVVTGSRYDVRLVRSICLRFGEWGRLNVCPIDRPGYVAKYLRKQYRAPCLRGLHLWARIGWGDSPASLVRNIESQSFLGDLYRAVKRCDVARVYGAKAWTTGRRGYQWLRLQVARRWASLPGYWIGGERVNSDTVSGLFDWRDERYVQDLLV